MLNGILFLSPTPKKKKKEWKIVCFCVIFLSVIFFRCPSIKKIAQNHKLCTNKVWTLIDIHYNTHTASCNTIYTELVTIRTQCFSGRILAVLVIFQREKLRRKNVWFMAWWYSTKSRVWVAAHTFINRYNETVCCKTQINFFCRCHVQ